MRNSIRRVCQIPLPMSSSLPFARGHFCRANTRRADPTFLPSREVPSGVEGGEQSGAAARIGCGPATSRSPW